MAPLRFSKLELNPSMTAKDVSFVEVLNLLLLKTTARFEDLMALGKMPEGEREGTLRFCKRVQAKAGNLQYRKMA